MPRQKSFGCPTELAVSVLGAKWRVVILAYLKEGVHRYGELKQRLPGISGKVLTQQLRALAREGLIERTIYSDVPARTEYELTEYGRSLIPVLDALYGWGLRHGTQRADARLELAVAPQQITALGVSLKAGREAVPRHGAVRRSSAHR
jgi:DNA-binding HxlR family transcriptional regulator